MDKILNDLNFYLDHTGNPGKKAWRNVLFCPKREFAETPFAIPFANNNFSWGAGETHCVLFSSNGDCVSFAREFPVYEGRLVREKSRLRTSNYRYSEDPFEYERCEDYELPYWTIRISIGKESFGFARYLTLMRYEDLQTLYSRIGREKGIEKFLKKISSPKNFENKIIELPFVEFEKKKLELGVYGAYRLGEISSERASLNDLGISLNKGVLESTNSEITATLQERSHTDLSFVGEPMVLILSQRASFDAPMGHFLGGIIVPR